MEIYLTKLNKERIAKLLQDNQALQSRLNLLKNIVNERIIQTGKRIR